MQDEQQKEHKQGTPWKIVKKTNTYDDATAYRDGILESWAKENLVDMQIKIRRMNEPAGFTIRTRLDPEVAEKRKQEKSSKSKSKKKQKKKHASNSNDKSNKSD